MLGEDFTVVAARCADDLWIDIQRHRRPRPEYAPAVSGAYQPLQSEVAPEPAPEAEPEPQAESQPGPESAPEPDAPASEPAPEHAAAPAPEAEDENAHQHAGPREVGTAVSSTGAAVIPMNRPVRVESPKSLQLEPGAEMTRLLAAAAERRATALYLTSGAFPFTRVDGDVQKLQGLSPLSASDVESLVLESAPDAVRDAVRDGEACEWLIDNDDAGRVRCYSFRDSRGSGAVFEMLSARPLSVEMLGLPAEARDLASESDGLVIIAAPRGQGRTTLSAAFLEAINAQRQCYVIALERQVRVIHRSRAALVSQRELQGTTNQAGSAARAALAERPDVLVMDDLHSVETMQVMFDAVIGGALGFVTIEAPTTIAAVHRIVDLFPEARRSWVRSVLAERMRGAVAQALLRHKHGGRVAAREILLPTVAVRTAITSGRPGDLPAALAEGRKHGLIALNESLTDLVRTEAVDLREAYRRTDDREGFLRALRRERVDLAVVERLA